MTSLQSLLPAGDASIRGTLLKGRQKVPDNSCSRKYFLKGQPLHNIGLTVHAEVYHLH